MKLEAFPRIYMDKKKIIIDHYDGSFTEVHVYDKETGEMDNNPDEQKLKEIYAYIVKWLSSVSKLALNEVAEKHYVMPMSGKKEKDN